MLEHCRQIQLSLNIIKCIFSTPIGILLGHVVCKDGVKFDMAKIKIILDLKPPVNQTWIIILLDHTGYYKKFICHYLDITFPMDELLRKDVEFKWSQECQESFNFLKKMLVEAPIIKFLDWSRKFHVHVDVYNVVVRSVVAQPYDDIMDHPNEYASRKLNKEEIKYSTTEREVDLDYFRNETKVEILK
jgi:hypothetical protein